MRRLSSAWQVMPRTATKPRPGLAAYEPDDAGQDGDASERAYERLKARLSDAWKIPVADNEVEGMATPDLPDDIAAMPLTAQHAYCAGYNKFMEEHPEADDERCDQAGREAIAATGGRTAPCLRRSAGTLSAAMPSASPMPGRLRKSWDDPSKGARRGGLEEGAMASTMELEDRIASAFAEDAKADDVDRVLADVEAAVVAAGAAAELASSGAQIRDQGRQRRAPGNRRRRLRA